jgi:hypothetical protein
MKGLWIALVECLSSLSLTSWQLELSHVLMGLLQDVCCQQLQHAMFV